MVGAHRRPDLGLAAERPARRVGFFAADRFAALRTGRGADGFALLAPLLAGAPFPVFFSCGARADLRSRWISFSLSSRRAPSGRWGSRNEPIATRRSFWTGCPMDWNISRIWRVRPWVSSIIHQEFSLSASPRRRAPAGLKGAREVIFAGAVRWPSRTMPARRRSSWASLGIPRTLTSYVLVLP